LPGSVLAGSLGARLLLLGGELPLPIGGFLLRRHFGIVGSSLAAPKEERGEQDEGRN